MILIGSSAIKHWFPEFPREPKDKDFAVNSNNHKSSRETEYLFNPVLAKHINSDILSPSEIATLKASHLFWNINWDKHMFDLQWLLKKGCKIDYKLFWELYEYWGIYHGANKRSDLKMTKDEFFTNAVNYDVAEHDELHKILNPTPIYTMCLMDGKEVELDEQKFNDLTYEQKLDFVREEIMVMAYERHRGMEYYLAYSRMLKKFIISHAPLFSLTFILENYLQLTKPKFNYIKQINYGINQHQGSK